MRALIGALGATVLGAAILTTSAFASSSVPATTMTLQRSAPVTNDRPTAFDRLNDILTQLVQKGVITQAQKDAILDAVKNGRGGRDRDLLRAFVGDVLRGSADYLGVPVDRIKGELHSGKSLGQIANEVPGKSRDGLVAALDQAADARIQAGVDNGKITADQAAQLTPKVHDAIAKIVDRSWKPKDSGSK